MEIIDSLLKFAQNNYKSIQTLSTSSIVTPAIILTFVGIWQRYKLFNFLYQTPYIKITKKSLLPIIEDGMGGYHQTTFVQYDIYNAASHDNLIKEQSITLLPRFKTFRHYKNNAQIDKYSHKEIHFTFDYKIIRNFLCWNIARIKITDIKNRKIKKLFWFRN